MNAEPIRSLVICGGGTAGWMTAAAAARYLSDGQRAITLIESDAISTVGVGEATIPPILQFNRLLGIAEEEFVRATKGTFKLGIEFADFSAIGERYFHAFGNHGYDLQGVAFHQFWLKHRHSDGIPPLSAFSMSAQAAALGKFAPPDPNPRVPLSQLAYAYHFDAALYARFLRGRAEAAGVVRTEGRIVAAERDRQSGDLLALQLENGQRIEGDLFIDCSGFRSLLLGEHMGVGYRDWSHWLPCDRAVTMPSAPSGQLLPYTKATATTAGWRWRIPLQHRTGNGHVYSSAHMEDEEALRQLQDELDGPPAGTPRTLRFKAGMRERLWEGNVIGIGLAGGFIEPMESTSIHLIQQGISKMLFLFPGRQVSPVERREYNRLMTAQFETIRDFIVLHYHATRRDDSPFWRQLRTMPIPDSLAHKLELFREKGRVLRYDDELFDVPSWLTVFLGQNVEPVGHDAVVDAMDDTKVRKTMKELAIGYRRQAERMPTHADHIRRIGTAVTVRAERTEGPDQPMG